MYKKLISAALSAAVFASAAPSIFAADGSDTVVYNFGAQSVDGAVTVSADTEYSASLGYGFLGLKNGSALDPRIDGWTMTVGYDLELANGGTDGSADESWVATTKNEETGIVSPIRFAMKSPTNTFYKIKVNMKRADEAKEARVNLFTEKRHQRLVDEPIPAEGLTYEGTVHVHNNWGKNTHEYVDTMLNIAAEGENVAISSIEVTKLDGGKTLWILSDSTGCEQTAAIPYFPLDHCQGIGSALIKYLGTDWSLVNEAESGLSAASAKNHFANFINHVQPGDIVWFEFGHNDDKSTTDPATNGYLSSLESYYNSVTEKGAYFVAVSPVTRCTSGQFSNGTWNPSLTQYGAAAENFVEEKIAAGAENIAYIDLDTSSAKFLDGVYSEMKNAGYDYGSDSARFYYFVSRSNKNDYTHPNDYGADNFAKLALDEAAAKLDASKAYKVTADTDAQAVRFDASYDENGALVALSQEPVSIVSGDNYFVKKDGARTYIWSGADTMKPYLLGEAGKSELAQAKVFARLLEGSRDVSAVRVGEEIFSAGKAPNAFYPMPLVEVVKYQYPLILDEITFSENGIPESVTATWVESDLQCVYGYAVVDIYDKDGNKKGSYRSADFFDHSGDTVQTLTFPKGTVAFDAAAGDTFRAYTIEFIDGGGITDTIVSTTLTEDSLIDIKKTLMEDKFTGYDMIGAIIGSNGWSEQGHSDKEEECRGHFELNTASDGSKYAKFNGKGAAPYYVYRGFEAVTDGQLMVKFDMKYNSGTLDFFITDGNRNPADWNRSARIAPFSVKTSDNKAKLYKGADEICTINTGVWTTIKLVVDIDYGKYYLTVAGTTYTIDEPAFQTTGTPSPAKLAMLAMINNQKNGADVDLTNILIASLNTAELPDFAVTAVANDSARGTVTGSGTYKMNTTATFTAVPAEGYALTCWKDAAGNVISEEESISMRVRENLSLTAVFDKQFGLDGIKDYSVKPNKSGMRAAAGETAQINVLNPVDENNNQILNITNTDAQWSCDTAGITVSDSGLVTVGEDYSLGGNKTAKVNVTCTLNGIKKTVSLTVYSYAYYESVNENTNYTGPINTIAQKQAMVFGGDNSKYTYTLGDVVKLDKATKITYSHAWSGSNTCGQYRTLNFKDSAGDVVFSMYYEWDGLNVDGTTHYKAITKDTWTTVSIEIANGTATVKVGDITASKAISGTEIAAIEFAAAKSVPADRLLGISEIIVEQ